MLELLVEHQQLQTLCRANQTIAAAMLGVDLEIAPSLDRPGGAWPWQADLRYCTPQDPCLSHVV